MSSLQAMSRTTRLAVRLIAAKQDLVSMGYPEIIARLFYEKYGKLTPLIAKWYKEYNAHVESPDWWSRIYSAFGRGPSVQSMVHLYEAGVDPESFRRVCEHEDIHIDFPHTQGQVDEFRQELVPEIRAKFFAEIFFTYSPLMQDINSGKLTDVAPYKRLPFREAEIAYDKRRHFAETEPLKVYDNGFKWIDTGKKSIMLAETMKNCGSAGVMSSDKDRTILTLFGPTNKPHVMVTYSPNQKRISGDECAGSSPVKPEYHNYVLDLASQLGARFDVWGSKSPELRLKYQLRDKAQSIKLLQASEYGDSYFGFVVNGEKFYTNGSVVVSGDDVDRVQEMIDEEEISFRSSEEDTYKIVLDHRSQPFLSQHGVTYIPIDKFVEEDEFTNV